MAVVFGVKFLGTSFPLTAIMWGLRNHCPVALARPFASSLKTCASLPAIPSHAQFLPFLSVLNCDQGSIVGCQLLPVNNVGCLLTFRWRRRSSVGHVFHWCSAGAGGHRPSAVCVVAQKLSSQDHLSALAVGFSVMNRYIYQLPKSSSHCALLTLSTHGAKTCWHTPVNTIVFHKGILPIAPLLYSRHGVLFFFVFF